jgi:hypothetical protein
MKTAAFNKVRMENQKKTFFWNELEEVLTKGGISKDITMYANRYSHFDKSVIDGKTVYAFKTAPMHKNEMEQLYNAKRQTKQKWLDSKKEVGTTPTISTDQAWDTLVNAGVIKTKFNINTLKAKYPKIYLECLEYELNVTKQ